MLVRLDALFEGILGIVVLLGGPGCVLAGSDFPHPVGTALLLIAGLLLLALCGLIWSGRVGVRALAIGNAVSALAGLMWLIVGAGWSAAGAGLGGVPVAVLAVLAAAQAATLRA